MTNISRLQMLARLTKNKTDIAAKRYSEALAYLNKEKERKEELIGYANEYRSKLTNVDKEIRASRLTMHSDFYTNLQNIIKRQDSTIQAIENEVNKRKAHWLRFYKQHKTLIEYIDRLIDERRQELDLQEQKELDTLVNDIQAFMRSAAG